LSYPADEPGYPGNSFPIEPFEDSFVLPARPRKFQSRLWLHALLLVLTIASTTIAGATHYAVFASEFAARPVSVGWGLLLQGFWYSGTLLCILGAHEMGHYLLCRRYNVDASLPYFIPMPPFLFLTGTLGAVIKIREAFPNRKILFDIGVGGPIAGFVVLVPALFYGMTMSNVVPAPTQGSVLFLGEPLLFKLAMHAVFGAIGDGYTINIHPMVFAAWFGMLATALNLLPFGQLDGGHITYATLGRWATPVSVVTVTTAVLMTVFVSMSWMVMTLMMVVMIYMLGPRHPRVLDEHEALGAGRKAVAVLALIIFMLCFTPVPIQLQDLVGGR
jgi:membrane-associated protease RseP (regulator of RpoE activity)